MSDARMSDLSKVRKVTELLNRHKESRDAD